MPKKRNPNKLNDVNDVLLCVAVVLIWIMFKAVIYSAVDIKFKIVNVNNPVPDTDE